MRDRTWILEMLVVALALFAANTWASHGHAVAVEIVGALAVLAAFGHAQVAERMREREALKSKPDVHCHRWSTRYFFAKELLWLSYFVAHRSWSALVGVGVFLLYPLWRKWWRYRFPIGAKRLAWAKPAKVYIDGREFDMMPGADIVIDKPWSAGFVLRLDVSGCEFIAARSRARADMAILFKLEGGPLVGHAKPHRLQFFDDPNQPTFRFASFNVMGIGELSNV